jgi:hypothetical protein
MSQAKQTKKEKGKVVMNSDIYGGGDIKIGPRDLGAESQGTASFGMDDSTIVSAKFTMSTVKSRGAGEKVKGGGVSKDKMAGAAQGEMI